MKLPRCRFLHLAAGAAALPAASQITWAPDDHGIYKGRDREYTLRTADTGRAVSSIFPSVEILLTLEIWLTFPGF
jgi:hypothetical protein